MEGSLGFHFSSSVIASPGSGLAWKTAKRGHCHSENSDVSHPSSLVWHVDSPTSKWHFRMLFGAQKCVFLGKKMTIFLSRGWELSARWGKWVAGVISFHSFYLRADLVPRCVPRARMSPTPQYLQCGHSGIICWTLNIVRHSTARLKGYLTVYRTTSCDLEVRMLITV